jgi:hypothetical protein
MALMKNLLIYPSPLRKRRSQLKNRQQPFKTLIDKMRTFGRVRVNKSIVEREETRSRRSLTGRSTKKLPFKIPSITNLPLFTKMITKRL